MSDNFFPEDKDLNDKEPIFKGLRGMGEQALAKEIPQYKTIKEQHQYALQEKVSFAKEGLQNSKEFVKFNF